jgi:hypothetical protein
VQRLRPGASATPTISELSLHLVEPLLVRIEEQLAEPVDEPEVALAVRKHRRTIERLGQVSAARVDLG